MRDNTRADRDQSARRERSKTNPPYSKRKIKDKIKQGIDYRSLFSPTKSAGTRVLLFGSIQPFDSTLIINLLA